MRPTDKAIILAMMLAGRQLAADEIAAQLKELGFEVRAQQLAAWLHRMARQRPALVAVSDRFSWREYRVTEHGQTLLHARWRGLPRVLEAA